MQEENFEQSLENLSTPGVDRIQHQQLLKIAIVNAKKSSRWGLVFILIPCLFLIGIYLTHVLDLRIPSFTAFEDWMARIDKIPLLKWIFPLLLLGLPLVGFILNALAVTHFYWEKKSKELMITLKWKPLNIMILVISGVILTIFLWYAVRENIHHQLLEKLD